MLMLPIPEGDQAALTAARRSAAIGRSWGWRPSRAVRMRWSKSNRASGAAPPTRRPPHRTGQPVPGSESGGV